MKLKKRALTHVDWVISIAIFLIFITLLFLLIRPDISGSNLDPVLNILEKSFERDAITVINMIPFSTVNGFTADEPIVLKFDNQQDENKISFLDGRAFVLLDEKIFFYGKENGHIVYSNQEYNMTEIASDLTADINSAEVTSENFRVNYNAGLIDSIEYDGQIRAYNFAYPFSGGSSFETKSFISKNCR